MNEIVKDRFWIWLMWLLPIACTGIFSIYIWTTIQICICISQFKKEKEPEIPLRERKEILEMNKIENLTEKEKQRLHSDPRLIKVAEGVYVYDGD